jgi:serine/threonine protein kinase
VKPARILLEGDHAWLTGFGVASGSADYLAPERPRGAPADVYALGCVLWECLAGRPPHLFDAGREAPSIRDLRPELPEALDDVLARALATEPERRWERAGALVRAARLVAR